MQAPRNLFPAVPETLGVYLSLAHGSLQQMPEYDKARLLLTGRAPEAQVASSK